MITMGIDIGSLSTKSVILDEKKGMLSHDVVLTGGSNSKAAELTYNNALSKAGLNKNDIDIVVTTGYGRENVKFSDKNVSEITCHAKGMFFLNPGIRTVLDIGGQDSKAILLDLKGNVVNFSMNDKCAAGCGRFLEVMARALDIKLEDLGDISQSAEATTHISSMCTVFAETEVVSSVAIGTPIPNIVKGLHESVADRSSRLLTVISYQEPLGMSGGVAKNPGVVKAIEKKLNKKIYVPEYPQIIGALGAAFIGQNSTKK